jgi:hypothetical protein
VLCHDEKKPRAKQISRLVDIAEKLRHTHNNYSAVRSFVAGINHAASEGDETMTYLQSKSPERHHKLTSFNVLFKNHRAHGAYRMALRTAKRACVPDVSVPFLIVISLIPKS